jgi:hypothetical protein
VDLDRAWERAGRLAGFAAVYTGNSLSELTPVTGQTNYDPGFFGFTATAGVTYQIALNTSNAVTAATFLMYWEQTSMALALSNLTVFREGETVPLQITTTETPGHFVQLDYLDGETVIGTTTAEPLSFSWTAPPPGEHTITARGVTAAGLATTSAPIAIIVRPRNDVFANRISVDGLIVSMRGSLAGATFEPGEPYHGFMSSSHSIWWSWTAPRDGRIWLDYTGSAVAPIIALYTGEALDTLTLVDQNYEGGFTPRPRLEINVSEGTTYQIAVADVDEGDVAVNLQMLRPPTNDLFQSRTIVTGTNVLLHVNTIEASREEGEPDLPPGCGYLGRSVWWSWTAPASGSALVDASGTENGCVRVGVFTGDLLTNLHPVPLLDPYYGSERGLFEVQGGQTYQIALDSGLNELADFSAHLTFKPRPRNDDFAQRLPLSGWSFDFFTETLGATREPGEPPHQNFTGPRTVWFTWKAPASGNVRLTPLSTQPMPVVSAYRGNTLETLQAVDTSWNPQHFTAVAGETYQLAIGSLGVFSEPLHIRMELLSPQGKAYPELTIIEHDSFTVTFKVSGLDNRPCMIELSTDLIHWEPLYTTFEVPAGYDDFEFVPFDAGNAAAPVFFRARLLSP